MHDNLIEKLYQEYVTHGYISENRIFSFLEENNVSLFDIDSVCDKLLSRGVIIRDDIEPFAGSEEDDTESDDRSQTDYEAIFHTVLEIDEGLNILIDYIRGVQPPKNREWQLLLPQAKTGNKYARTRLFEMYMRSVIRIALQFSQHYNQPLSDTIQNGFIGLNMAIDKFEFGKQDSFPQYYPLWVIQQIRREATPVKTSLYYPAHTKEESLAIYDFVNDHFCPDCQDNRMCPSLINGVMDILNCSEENAIDAINSLTPFESFEELFDSCSKDSETNTVVDIEDDSGSLLRSAEQKDLENHIREVVNALPDRARQVIILRYGLNGGREHTLEEVGNILHVTRERIRQIENKALRIMRHPSKSRKIKGYVDID